VFYAFDLLGLDGKDLRARPLIERKQMLRQIVPKKSSGLLYASHLDGQGAPSTGLRANATWKASSPSESMVSMVMAGSRSGTRAIRSTRGDGIYSRRSAR
jgi:ATP-dependent DNA ligase